MLLTTPAMAGELNSPNLIIDDIVCKGNATTDCGFITKKYYQNKGDILDPDEVADAKLRLGTLIQFRGVDIRLEKGHQRGHVIVVFNVREADNIQYEWGSSFTYDKRSITTCNAVYLNPWDSVDSCTKREGDVGSLSAGGTITDFNFLGTGKRLSLSFNGIRSDGTNTLTYNYQSEIPDFADLPSLIEMNYDQNSLNLALDYYDPHLFDSSHYYWRATLSHFRNFRDDTQNFILGDQEPSSYNRDRKASSTPYHLEIGRRFASHSYVSVDLDREMDSNLQSSTWVGLNYGWDSTDDTLFATKGSVFNSRYRYASDHHSLSLDYTSHHSIDNNQVLTFGAYANYLSFRRFNIYREIYNQGHHFGLSARYTNIDIIDDFEGTYSGWFAEVGIGTSSNRYQPDNNLDLYVKAGYTYQTSSMIYRFSLGLSTQGSL